MTPQEAMSHWKSNPEAWEWIESRPPVVRALVERMPPGTWWVLKDSKTSLYTPYSYNENGTLTVTKFDILMPILSYGVFGCDPDDFEWTPLTPETVTEAFHSGQL